MEGIWLTPTRKAYIYRDKKYRDWTVALCFGPSQFDVEQLFGFSSFDAAVEALPGLWKHGNERAGQTPTQERAL